MGAVSKTGLLHFRALGLPGLLGEFAVCRGLGLQKTTERNARFAGLVRTQEGHKHKHFIGISLPYWPSFSRGFIWDIPILVFAYVFFWGPRPLRALGFMILGI